MRGPGPGLSVADAVATEGTDASLDFVVTLSPQSSETVTVAYETSDGTATAPADYAAASGTLTFAPGETVKTVPVAIVDDGVEDSGETMTLTLSGATNAAIDDREATGTINNTEVLTAAFSDVPSEHDGSSAFTFELTFSEDVGGLSFRTLKFGGIRVSGGTVTRALRRPPGVNQYWTIHVEPDGDEDVTISLPETTDCAADGAVCAPDGRMLSEAVSATVPGPAAATDEAQPLTASFSELPSEHDGSAEFTFELTFSEDVDDLSFRTLKFGGIEAAGGTVTRALRHGPGTNKHWTIHVEPDGDGDVTITLPETTDCESDGAVCAPDGRMLSNESRATVQGPTVQPLTASFSGAPSEHDGETAFTLRVAFSEALPQGSKPQLRRALSVAGGSKSTILRVDGRLDLWEVKITPSGTGAVTVTLASAGSCGDDAALCTSDGRALTNGPVTATVQGPPGLSVADAEVEEAPGAALAFVVTLDRAASGAVTWRMRPPPVRRRRGWTTRRRAGRSPSRRARWRRRCRCPYTTTSTTTTARR